MSHRLCHSQYSSSALPISKLSPFSFPCDVFLDKMGRMPYLALNSDPLMEESINSDINELKIAATRLLEHATKLGGKGLGTSFFKWLASFAAMWVLSSVLVHSCELLKFMFLTSIIICSYLLILDRTNWRTNMLTSLLVPYIFFSLPQGIFDLLRW